MLYAQPENYDGFTRPVISKLIPFPMQYRVPLHQKDIAVRQCAAVGLLTASGANQKASPDTAERYPSLSKLQEQLEAARRKSALFMGRARDNMRVLAYCHEVLDTLLANKLVDPTLSAEELEKRGGKLDSVELLVAAHLRVQTLDELPVQVVASLLKNEYVELWQYLSAVWLKLNASEVEVVAAAPEDVPNLTNYVKSFFY
ncbi:hypothetical protein DV113_000740 [Geotrichum candidum]|nr:hypothetical protein DV454_002896 [Geotrichum candidum]KAF5121249.1 hypothetical protein DV452_000946 [Geotrichum candidum]KAF7501168.1 hypothetical protein DV113_000740 [Geotrichum candidum]KAI8134043.1 hypothetical protein DUD61_002258 [Geotrichum candidum]KAI9213450.1 hypothetical protein DS838_001623 [Geotrichum bryndzae]